MHCIASVPRNTAGDFRPQSLCFGSVCVQIPAELQRQAAAHDDDVSRFLEQTADDRPNDKLGSYSQPTGFISQICKLTGSYTIA